MYEKNCLLSFRERRARLLLRTDPALSDPHDQFASGTRPRDLAWNGHMTSPRAWNELDGRSPSTCDGVKAKLQLSHTGEDLPRPGRRAWQIAVLLPPPTPLPFVQGGFRADGKRPVPFISPWLPLERTPMMQLIDSLAVLEAAAMARSAGDYLR
jgi:hypothetical protein